VEYPGLVFLLAQLVLAVVVVVEDPRPEHLMAVWVQMAAAMVGVADLVERLPVPELLELEALAPMVFLFLPTHRLVGYRNGSPTPTPNTQLQYPPESKSRLLPPPLALLLSLSTLRRSIANQQVGTNLLASQYQRPKLSWVQALFPSTPAKPTLPQLTSGNSHSPSQFYHLGFSPALQSYPTTSRRLSTPSLAWDGSKP